MRYKTIIFLFLLLAPITTLANSGGEAKAQEEQQLSLEEEFRRASQEYEVPVSVLKAMGYVNTRWAMPSSGASDYEEGGPSEGSPEARGAYGTMQLLQNPSENTLGRAAELTEFTEEELKNGRTANILGGAAVLSEIEGGEKPTDINGWYDSVAEYGGGNLYANQVYETLESGVSGELSGGETMVLEAQPEAETEDTFSAQASGDYGRSTWYGAHGSNYTAANRGQSQINKVVIHVTQGSWAGALSWFRDSRANASAHYTVRSSDGKIGQSVREKSIGWHAGNWDYNKRSIGIEHEGYVSNSSWFTDSMYRSSARLTAHLAKKYNIAINRRNIIGHHEVPGCSGSGGGAGCHTDPGRYWNWDKYMRLVKGYAGSSTGKPAYKQTVDNASSRFSATGAWDTNTFSDQKYGESYRATKPGKKRAARFKLKIPKKSQYVVKARWPSSSGYNNRTNYKIRTTSGWKRKVVSQRTNGGKWMRLGKFSMNPGDRVYVKVSSRTNGKGWIIADAVKVVRR